MNLKGKHCLLRTATWGIPLRKQTITPDSAPRDALQHGRKRDLRKFFCLVKMERKLHCNSRGYTILKLSFKNSSRTQKSEKGK